MNVHRKALRVILVSVAWSLVGYFVLYRFAIKFGRRFDVRLPFYGFKRPFPTFLNWILDNRMTRRRVPVYIDRTGVRSSESVLELGPGPGIYTVEAARRVGSDGRLIAVDIQPEMIAKVEKIVREAGFDNVEAIVADACNLPLPDESIDRAFMSGVLGEIPDEQRALAELKRVLKPDGVLSITEAFVDPNYPLARTRVREVEAADFVLSERSGNFFVYTLNFRKAE